MSCELLRSWWLDFSTQGQNQDSCLPSCALFVSMQFHLSSNFLKKAAQISTFPKTIPLICKSIPIDRPEGCLYGRMVSLQQQSAGGELLLRFCSFYNWHIVVAIVLCDEAHRLPVVLMVVWVVGDKLLCVCLVESVNLNGALQGVAQQEHLHLPRRHKAEVGE